MRFILQKALDPELFKKVEDSLPNWPEFRLYALFRESFTNNETKYKDEDIALLVGLEKNHFENIDEALFMLCRLEDSLKLDISKKGIATTGIEYRLDDLPWNLEYVRDIFLK
jgi:hypothetical protein